jgi:hypothetical protein
MDNSLVDVSKLSETFALEVVENLKKENNILKSKLRQLEGVLMSQSSTLTLRLSPEEQICIRQIAILHERSEQKELNKEEVLKLDLLVKNLKIIRQEANMIIESNKSSKLTEAELLALVTQE